MPARVPTRFSRAVVTGTALLLAVLMAMTMAPADAAPTWLPVKKLDTGMRPVELLTGPDGTVHMILVSETSVFALRRRPGGAWEAAHLLSDREAFYPEAAVARDGTITVVWTEKDEPGWRVLMTASRKPGGAWSSPEQHTFNGEGMRQNHAFQPDIAVDRAGNVTVVFDHYFADTGLGSIKAFTRLANGPKTPITTLSRTGASLAQAAADANGRVTVVWDRKRSDGRWAIESNHGSITEAWKSPADADTVSASDYQLARPKIALDDAGTAVVVWERYNPAATTESTLHAARRVAGGSWVAKAGPISVGEAYGPVALAARPQGGAVVLWTAGWLDTISATMTPSGTWQTPESVSHSVSAYSPALTLTTRGVDVAAWYECPDSGCAAEGDPAKNVIKTARRRDGGAWSAPQTLSTDTGDARDPLLASDPQGDVVAAWHIGYPSITQARVLDSAGPITRVTKPTVPFSLGEPLVEWSARDTWTPVSGYNVRYAAATAAGNFSTTPWMTTGSSAATSFMYAAPGSTYCFSARAFDDLGNTGLYSAERCTAAPMNDRALLEAGGWTRRDAPAAYRGTLSSVASKDATLTSPIVRAMRISLVASRIPDGGSVRVYFGSTLLKTVALTPLASQSASTTYRRQVIPIAVFDSRREGRVRIVTTSAKPVAIEGLGISAK